MTNDERRTIALVVGELARCIDQLTFAMTLGPDRSDDAQNCIWQALTHLGHALPEIKSLVKSH